MNPFDIRAALLAKHAQHVVLIHFPIALFIAGVLFDFLGQITKKRVLAEVAYYDLLGAAISAVPVVATGLLAWQFQLEVQKLKGILLMHLVLGFMSLALLWIVWGLHARSRQEFPGKVPAFRLGLELLTVALVGLTGHLGGFLSGVNASN
ncbi:MAG TPA: DUF2231 domain-containing protein [Candidatus Acidoferrum sp.]|nr:DUF2231 domain-containing protein [Candidatus Acidoferrum sp.]